MLKDVYALFKYAAWFKSDETLSGGFCAPVNCTTYYFLLVYCYLLNKSWICSTDKLDLVCALVFCSTTNSFTLDFVCSSPKKKGWASLKASRTSLGSKSFKKCIFSSKLQDKNQIKAGFVVLSKTKSGQEASKPKSRINTMLTRKKSILV